MASKLYRGQTCAYCATPGAATTADHVFARQFFPIDQRDGLPKVPACTDCNGAKAVLEHYLTAVLPFAGRHPDALTALNDMVPARLAANQRLHTELSSGQAYRVQQIGGRFVRSMTLPFDSEKLTDLLTYIARGLALSEFGVVIPADYNVSAAMMPDEVSEQLESLFAKNGRRCKATLGDGVFDYAGLQSVEEPYLTVWKFRIMGGIQTSGDRHRPDEWPEVIWATSSKTASPLDL
jgi:hypothetical protein